MLIVDDPFAIAAPVGELIVNVKVSGPPGSIIKSLVIGIETVLDVSLG
jgi:hypothetical protein